MPSPPMTAILYSRVTNAPKVFASGKSSQVR
jgi:hypothetical protein